ncbi:MAG: hypothetical protein KDH94_02165 [Coxiellaceae bacterium]|nr:hypothetical protein [Coxiellaceae bacterium]
MKKKLSMLALILSGSVLGSAFAATPVILNTVSYQLSEQKWVKSTEATATVAVNATVSDQNIAKLRESILSNLQEIAKGEWHITQFIRTTTSSGLQSVNVRAQVRLPVSQTDQINVHAKSVSKAGQTYSIVNLDFTPSPADYAAAQASLREKIYGEVQSELNQLNKQFPNAHYFVHQVRFSQGAFMPRTVALVKMPMANSVVPNVSQMTRLTAMVMLSSKADAS